MSMSESIVSTVFRFINFGVVCGVSAYIFKKNILPSTKEKIAAKHAALQDLHIESKKILEMQHDLEQEISDQELDGKNLYDQITIWSSSFDRQCDDQRKEQDVLLQQSKERSKLQTKCSVENKLCNNVLSKALIGAEQELQDKYSSEKEGRAFLASIVKNMSKDLS